MKTIAFNRSRGSFLTSFFVLGALGALYYYRRQGGSMTNLYSGISSGVGSVRGMINDALTNIGANRSGVGARGTAATGTGAHEISTTPEDLDRLPAT